MWMDIAAGVVLLLGIYGFTQMVGWEKRTLTRRTTRTAEDMYGQFADPLRKQRQHAKQREHDGELAEEPAEDPSVRR